MGFFWHISIKNMLDSQKLAFENFLMGYKHGVYIFTKDACQACQDYKKEIEWINNCYLYIVEVNTEKERQILEKLIDRQGFPITVCYLDNEIKFIRNGVLSDGDEDWIKIYNFLMKFGDHPLPPDEIQSRIERQKNRCLLTYYIFPTSLTDNEKEKLMNCAAKYNELPIDIDNICKTLDKKERERMLSGSYHFAKLIIWKNGTQDYTPFSQDILIGYTNANQEIKFIYRDVNEDL